MDLNKLYYYALSGALERLRACKRLYEMCLDVSDGDAADEYAKKTVEVTEDVELICNYLGYDPKVFDDM